MASSSVTRFSFHAIVSLSIITTLLLTIAIALEFTVGGPSGWTVPPAQDPDFYNHWAFRNRFHVGDTLNFLNEADSVLVVSGIENYMQCNITDPVQELPAGNGVFQFTRYGFYFFISDQVDRCLAGQRMIVLVMLHPNPDPISPSLAPAPSSSKAVAPSPSTYNNRKPSISSSLIFFNSSMKIDRGYGTSLGIYGALFMDGL